MTTKAQHTPGPWFTDETDASDVYRYVLPAGREGLVCRVPLRMKDSGEANARLIAAAPDMLAALRSIAAITTCTDQDPEAMCAEIQGICREALAKATAECEANAHPIAATPDLLEAAIELKDVCNRPSAARTRAEAWRKLDKAIAKVTKGAA